MSDTDPALTADQRFATDLEVADAQTAPARSADSLVVHGMLSMIAPDEPARLEARIGRAIAAVHAESERTSPIARIGHAAPGLGAAHALRSQHAVWRRRIALAGGGIGIAAVLGFAVLFTPSGQSQSGSQAYAALDSIRAATARTEDRTFRVRIEHTGPRDAVRPSPAPPRRDGVREAVRDGMREAARDGMREAARDGMHESREDPREPRDRNVNRMREGIRDALRDREGVREGELVLGSGGRYTLTWRGAAPERGPSRGVVITTGFDGREYWAVLPDGSVRTADHPAKIKLPPLFGTEPAREGEVDDAEQLTLDSMLARLERGYEITFADRSSELGKSGTPLIEVTATRRAGAGRRDRDRMPPGGPRPGGPPPGGPPPGPDNVRVLADASTFDVERVEARWTDGAARTMLIERIETPEAPASRPVEWFTPGSHARGR